MIPNNKRLKIIHRLQNIDRSLWHHKTLMCRVSFEGILVDLSFFWFTWVHLGLICFTFVHYSSLGFIWVHLGSLEFTWVYWGSLGFT